MPDEESAAPRAGLDGGDHPPSGRPSSLSAPSDRSAPPDVRVDEQAFKGIAGANTRFGSLSRLRRSIADTLSGKSDSHMSSSTPLPHRVVHGSGRKKSPSRRYIYRPFPSGNGENEHSTPTGQPPEATADADGSHQSPSPTTPSERSASPDARTDTQASTKSVATKERTGTNTRFGSLSRLRRSIADTLSGNSDSHVSNNSNSHLSSNVPMPHRYVYKPKGSAMEEEEVPSTPTGQLEGQAQTASVASADANSSSEAQQSDGVSVATNQTNKALGARPSTPSERAASPDVQAEAQASVQELAARVAMKDTVAKSQSPWIKRDANTKRRLQKHPSLLNLHQDNLVQTRRAKFASLRRSVARRLSLRASVASNVGNVDRASSTLSPSSTQSAQSESAQDDQPSSGTESESIATSTPAKHPSSTLKDSEDAYDA